MPRSTRTQHTSGPGAPSGATDAGLREERDDRIRPETAAEHPFEAPDEGWSVLPRAHDRTAPPRIQILNPAPMIDCGRFPAKRTVGEWVDVSADVFRDGHEILRAVVRHRGPGDEEWRETPMRWIDREVDGDRWAGAFEVDRVGRWEFTVEAWSDLFATWRDELRRKLESGQHDLRGELSEGEVLLEEALERMKEGDGDGDRRLVEHVLVTLADAGAPDEAKHDAALGTRAARGRGAAPGSPRRHPAGAQPAARRRARARPLRRLVRALPALLRRLRGRPKAAAEAGRARLRRALPATDPPDRRRPTARAATTRSWPGRATPARPGRSAARTAATTPSTRSSARSRSSSGWLRRRASTASRSRSTSRSSARPTTPG